MNIDKMPKCGIIKTDFHQCRERAVEIFSDISGIPKECMSAAASETCTASEDKNMRMASDAWRVLGRIEDSIRIKASWSYSENVTIKDKRLNVGNTEINCAAFSRITPESVEGVFFYVLSAEECCRDTDKVNKDRQEIPIMEQLYRDLWGTAFVSAGREELEKNLSEILAKKDSIVKSSKKHSISNGFGPGFYGMNITEISKLPSLVDFGEAGVRVSDCCTLEPAKSCTGLYFAVNDSYEGPEDSCLTCIGNKSSCSLCSVNKHNL